MRFNIKKKKFKAVLRNSMDLDQDSVFWLDLGLESGMDLKHCRKGLQGILYYMVGSLLPGVQLVKYSYETCGLEDLWRLLVEEVYELFIILHWFISF